MLKSLALPYRSSERSPRLCDCDPPRAISGRRKKGTPWGEESLSIVTRRSSCGDTAVLRTETREEDSGVDTSTENFPHPIGSGLIP